MATQIQTQQSRLRIRAGSNLLVNDQRLAGVLLFTLAAQFMTVLMLAASIAPDYDFSGAAISDLGVIRETALLFNVSLVVVGVLNVSGGYVLWHTHRRLRLLIVYALAGAGAIGAGVVSLNTSELHSIFALVAFLFFNLEAIATAPMLRSPMKLVSVISGLIGIAFVGVMIAGDSGNSSAFGAIGHGGTERMIVYPVMLWLLAFGGYLMGGGRTTTASDQP